MHIKGSARRVAAAAVAATTIVTGAGLALTTSDAAAAVRSCGADTPLGSRPTVRNGDTGSCVVEAQRRLIAAGYSVGSSGADGIFGAATLAATKRFQAAKGLAADGIIGPLTWAKLAAAKSAPSGYVASRCGNAGTKVLMVFDDYSPTVTGFRNLVRTAKTNNIGIGVAPNGNVVKAGKVDVGFARANGMLVVDHTYDHKDLTKLSRAGIAWEISQPYVKSNYVRPPYGAQNATVRSVFAEHGKLNCLWNLDPRDWDGKSPYAAADYIVRNAQPGSTVVVHLNHMGTQPGTLPYVKSGLAKRGIQLCPPWSGPTKEQMPTTYCS